MLSIVNDTEISNMSASEANVRKIKFFQNYFLCFLMNFVHF